MRLSVALVVGFINLFSLPLFANEEEAPTLDEIRSQQIEYRKQAMANEGRFKDIGPRERNELVDKQTQFLKLTEGKSALGDLAADDQVRAINTLEWIKAAIVKAENERVVCERVKVVGSNRPQRVCRTVVEMHAERDAATKIMEERSSCGPACRSN